MTAQRGRRKKSRPKDTERRLTLQLKRAIELYLDSHVKRPTLETIDKEATVQQDIAVVLSLFKLTESLVLSEGKDLYLEDLSECPQDELDNIVHTLNKFISEPRESNWSGDVAAIVNGRRTKKHLVAYLLREVRWISISMLSASYVSAFVLIRSVFELLIGIASPTNGRMADRIASVQFLSSAERDSVKKIWNDLNAWAHPYGKWEKEVCPIYASADPIYHPALYGQAIDFLFRITDLFLVVAVGRFSVDAQKLLEMARESFPGVVDLYWDRLILFKARSS